MDQDQENDDDDEFNQESCEDDEPAKFIEDD